MSSLLLICGWLSFDKQQQQAEELDTTNGVSGFWEKCAEREREQEEERGRSRLRAHVSSALSATAKS